MAKQIISSIDKIAFTMEMERRISELAALYRGKTGYQLKPDGSLLSDFKLWRGMCVRYAMDKAASFPQSWHTRDEQMAEQRIAEWVIGETHRLNGTTSAEPYEIRVFD